MTLLEQLRKPEEVKRWFDQIGDQAANEIESLQQQLVAATRSKNEMVVDLYRRLDLLDDLNLHLKQQRAAMTAERDGLLAAKWVQQTDTHSKLCIALQQLAVMTQESADAKAQLTQESQDSINKQTIIDGLRSERARNECVLIKLKQRLAKMDATLTAIAGYAGENGCCPYGCDTPYIAQQALFNDHHDI